MIVLFWSSILFVSENAMSLRWDHRIDKFEYVAATETC